MHKVSEAKFVLGKRDKSFRQVSEGVYRERHVSCVRIRIIDAGKAVHRCKDTHMLSSEHDESLGGISFELYQLLQTCFPQHFHSRIHIGRLQFRDGELIDMCRQ
jgi:hypothetical protein